MPPEKKDRQRMKMKKGNRAGEKPKGKGTMKIGVKAAGEFAGKTAAARPKAAKKSGFLVKAAKPEATLKGGVKPAAEKLAALAKPAAKPAGKLSTKPAAKPVSRPATAPKGSAKPEIIGIYERIGAFGRVIPDDRREIKEIMILQGNEDQARQGDRVVVELSPQHSYRNLRGRSGADRVGRIIEVLGAGGDLAVAEKAVIRRLGLRQTFTPKQLEMARALNRPLGDKEIEGRLDLRQELLVTIDGEDTRDIDDAVSIQPLAGGSWQLGVHIADVSYYVKEGSLLDKEAFLRGTSVYFPDLVLPMLPPDLSNGICSLNHGVDRLAVSCLMTLDSRGKVTSHDIRPTVIRVRERLSYPQVQGYLNRHGWSTKEALAALEGKSQHSQGLDAKGQEGKARDSKAEEKVYFEDEAIGPMMIEAAKLCLELRRNRLNRGALEFELPESKIQPGPGGKATELKRKKRMLSEMIIEELMIIANETVALHYRKLGVPFPYRIHIGPSQDRTFGLNLMLKTLGLTLKGQRSGKKNKEELAITSGSYQQLLAEVKGKPEETIVSTLLLRSLNHAYYGPEEYGHFGLASDCYCHFTSPIRRYADLMVHRIIKRIAQEGKLKTQQKEALRAKVDKQCQQASICERIAEEAERKVDSLWKADYMSQFIGEEFSGVISGVTEYGLYVSLENTAEGMVHISRLEGYYECNEEQMCLYNYQSRQRYRLGDPITVRLDSVDVGAGYINFSLAAAQPQAKAAAAAKGAQAAQIAGATAKAKAKGSKAVKDGQESGRGRGPKAKANKGKGKPNAKPSAT